MTNLAKMKCVSCEGGVPPLTEKQITPYLKQTKKWEVVNNKMIEKNFIFKNFKEAMKFINKVGDIAEKEGHHPNILLHDYKKVRIVLTTHAIKGLSVNDFIVAYKIDSL